MNLRSCPWDWSRRRGFCGWDWWPFPTPNFFSTINPPSSTQWLRRLCKRISYKGIRKHLIYKVLSPGIRI